jgi:putative MFS transporter
MTSFQQIDRQAHLTQNQKLMVTVIIVVSCLEFFDMMIIGFVLAFINKPWNLTFGVSSVILLASGVGGIIGAFAWGLIADTFGRRPTLIASILTFTGASAFLAFTPEHGWLYLSIFRFVVGFGVGGFVINMPYVQEFLPARMRGFVSSLVSTFIPGGLLLGALLGAYLTPLIGWRGLFAVGVLPALLIFPILYGIPESPVWALRRGRLALARASTAWALQCRPEEVELGSIHAATAWQRPRWSELLRYPRSLMAGCLGNLGAVTGSYGITLWAPTLLVLVVGTTPQHASALMIGVSLAGMVGRVLCGYLSDIIGRKACGAIFFLGGAILLLLTGSATSGTIATISIFWLMLMLSYFFVDGGFSINGPYAAEMWPSHLRATGMGVAYGFGSIGKITGPVGLALIVGSSNFIHPSAMLPAVVPAFGYLAFWFALAGLAYGLIGIETRGRSFEEIDSLLGARPAVKAEPI